MNRSTCSLVPLLLIGLLSSAAALAAGCASNDGRARASGGITQLAFDSPEDALAALRHAASTGDRAYARSIFGPEVEEFSSGDPNVDAYERALFVAAINRRSELRPNVDGSVSILIGERMTAFPVPVVQVGNHWMFDTPAGVENLTDIRVGYHELRTIVAFRAIHAAQNEYRALDPDGDGRRTYAARVLSSEGKRDGLYWPTRDNEPHSPLGSFYVEGEVPLSRSLGYNGYFYRVLPKHGTRDDYQNDYLVVAYPAVYDQTGVMTFAMGADGVIYEKDLGAEGTRTAGQTVRVAGTGHEGWTIVRD